VLVPIVLKIVETIQPALTNTEPEPVEEPQKSEPEVASESLLPEPPVSQLMVENLQGFRGLLGSNDDVRVDSAVIDHWKSLYGDKKIEEVDVETLNGKTTRCKFKSIKGSKYDGKGIIQMPEKIQLTLQTKKGELVMVKPVVE
jgi:hypothetical protein